GPWSAHTAALLLLREAMAPKYGGEVIGGGAALISALTKSAESHGAVLRTNATVHSIETDSDGVTGVQLADGETIACKQVVSTLDPKKTFLELVGPIGLPLRLAHDAKHYRMRANTAVVSVLMSGPLESADGTAIESMRTGDRLDALELAFDAGKYRIIADRPALDIHVPSVADPSLCPDGNAVVQVLAHGVPYDYAEGWADNSGRDLVGDRVIREMVRLCPSMEDRVLDADVMTPRDIELTYGVSHGHLLHGEHAPDQLIFMRPTGQTGQYRTPIPGLWLAGGSSHPGGGLTCGPGALAAGAILGTKKGK
ncbi:MAG: phytoene dehydrogenase-like protein, partial [Myxococcota bacterium]